LRLQVSVLPVRLPAARYRTQATAIDASVFLLGGIDAAGVTVTDVYRFDPSTGSVSRIGALSTPTHGAAALTLGGRAVVFGGAGTSVHDVTQAFDPTSATTTVIGRLPGPLADLAAASVADKVVLLGGFNGSGRLDTVFASSDSGRSFTTLGRLAQAVRYPGVAADAGGVYLFGGLLSGGEYTGTFTTNIQRVDPATGATTIVGHLPIPLAHTKALVLDGRLLVVGGSTTGGASAAVLEFDPATATVTKLGALPQPVTDGAVAVVGDTAYVLGGIDRTPLDSILALRLQP
jgi:Galactose oxidase, central domain